MFKLILHQWSDVMFWLFQSYCKKCSVWSWRLWQKWPVATALGWKRSGEMPPFTVLINRNDALWKTRDTFVTLSPPIKLGKVLMWRCRAKLIWWHNWTKVPPTLFSSPFPTPRLPSSGIEPSVWQPPPSGTHYLIPNAPTLDKFKKLLKVHLLNMALASN